MTPAIRHRLLPLSISVTAVVFFLYGLLLHKHYAIDTYIVEMQGDLWVQHIALGRFVSATILKLCTNFGINPAATQNFFTFTAICLLSCATILLIRFFSSLEQARGKSTLFFLTLACLSSLCNLFTLHWFLFPEVTFIMILGLLLSIIALFYLRKSGLSNWLGSYIFILLALSCYQAVGPFFVIFAILYFACHNQEKPLQTTVKSYGKTLLLYFLAGLTNILLMHWCGIADERTAVQKSSPLHNTFAIFTNLSEKLESTGLGVAPLAAFLFFIAILLAVILISLQKNRTTKQAGSTILHLLFLLCCAFGATLAPHLLTSVVDISPRSIAAIMSLPGVISLFVFLQKPLSSSPITCKVFQGLLIAFFVLSAGITYRVELSRLATNKQDQKIAVSIIKEISDYQQQTGNTVTKIAFRHDQKPVACYPDQLCYGNFRAMGREISVIPLLFVHSGTRYFQVSMPEMVYQQNFKDKNWDTFSLEQLKFIGDTLYLMLY